jgi:hypothetical protein
VAVYEGLWDCSSCGTKGQRGSDHACQQCGATRPDDVKFYLPGQAPVVTDDAKLKQAKAGEDWYCEHCGSGTSNLLQECKQCGAPRGSSKSHHQAAKDREAKAKARGQVAPGAAPVAAKAAAGGGLAALVFVMLMMMACCCLAWAGRPVDVGATIAAKRWERSQQVEAYRTVQEEGWSVPGGGRVKREEQRVHHHDRVFDHNETRTRTVKVQTGTKKVKTGVRDMGNGFFEDVYKDEPVYTSKQETYQEAVYRQVPVKQRYFFYEIDKWVTDRTERAHGTNDEPRWPELKLQGDKQRAGARGESYTLDLQGQEGKAYSKAVPESEWRRYTVGQRVVITVSGSEVREIKLPGEGPN